MNFFLDNVPGPIDAILRARLYAPDGSTVSDLALVEGDPQEYSGTVLLDPTPADSVEAYEYEVREVLAQSAAGFNASTTVIIQRGDYGYASDGTWIQTLAVVSHAGYWTTQTAIERRYGPINVGVDADLDNDGSGTAAVWVDVLAEVDAEWDREVKRHGYALPADPRDADIDTDELSDGAVHPNFSTDYAVLSNLARDWARVKLYYARGWGDTGSPQDVAGKFAKLQADTWQRFLQVLGEGIDFPQDATADDFSVTAPVGLRLTMNQDGRAISGTSVGPYWDPHYGYRW